MEKLVRTYGKTFHTWHHRYANNELPVRVPQIMMVFTDDNQLRPDLLAARDSRFGNQQREKEGVIGRTLTRRRRFPGADAWQTGKAVQIADPAVPCRAAISARQSSAIR
jgi:hypothetical protein